MNKNEDEDKGINENKKKSNCKLRKKEGRALAGNRDKISTSYSSNITDSSVSNDVGCIKTVDDVKSKDANISSDEAPGTTNQLSDNTASKTNNMGNALAMTPLQKYSIRAVINSSIYVLLYDVILGSNEKKDFDLFEFTMPTSLLVGGTRESELARTNLEMWLHNKRNLFNNYKTNRNTDLGMGDFCFVDSMSVQVEEITLPSVIL